MERDDPNLPDERLLLKRIAVACLGIVAGGFIGGVVGAAIGQATEPSGQYLQGIRALADGVVGTFVGAWAGLLLVAVTGAIMESRNRQSAVVQAEGGSKERGHQRPRSL